MPVTHLPAALGPILDFLDMAGIAVFALSGALLAAIKKQTIVTFVFFAVSRRSCKRSRSRSRCATCLI